MLSNGSKTQISWTVDYSVSWSNSGELTPGVKYLASQTLSADLQGINTFHFTGSPNPQLVGSAVSANNGKFLVIVPAGIPAEYFSIGVGMNGSPAAAQNAAAGVNQTWVPHPSYQVALGNFAPGVVIDLGQVTNPAPIEFPLGKNNALASFTGGAWTVDYSPVLPGEGDDLQKNPATGTLVINGVSLGVTGIDPDWLVLPLPHGTRFSVYFNYTPQSVPAANTPAVFQWLQGRNVGNLNVTFKGVIGPIKWLLEVA